MPMTALFDYEIPRQLRGARGWARPSPRTASRLLLVIAMAGFADIAQAQVLPAPTGYSPNGLTAPHTPTGAAGVIPPPPLREIVDPKRAAGQPAKFTQARQQFVNPERAYDPSTGESFYWDCIKKTWFDSKKHVAVGFQGGRTSDGEIIPPPPKLELADSERTTSEGLMARITQARQDADNPARAYDPDSQQILVWDRRQRSWIDTKTGEAVGFLGRKGLSACQQAGAPLTPPSPTAVLAQADVLEDLLFKEHVAIAPSESSLVSFGMGQALLQLELLLTSKQSVIGGALRLTAPRAEAKPSFAGSTAAASTSAGSVSTGSASTGSASTGSTSTGSTSTGSASACLSCATREPCPPSCPELPASLQLSKAMLASPL
jgi:hypothetical protein